MQQSQDPMSQQHQPRHAEEVSEEPEVTLRDYLAVIFSGKWTICGITLLALLVGGWYALSTHPVYKADALLQAEKEQPVMPGMDELKSAMGQDSSPAQTHIELLKSRSILGRVVDKRGLRIQAEPVRFPLIGGAVARLTGPHPAPAEAWLGLQGYAWGGERIRVQDLKVPERKWEDPLILRAREGNGFTLLDPDGERLLQGEVGEPAVGSTGEGEEIRILVSDLSARPGTRFHIAKRSKLAAMQSLRARLSVNLQEGGRMGGDTGIINLGLTGQHPSRVEATLNTLTSVYLRKNVEHQSAQAEERLKFLNQQLPQLQEELESAEERLSEFQQEHEVMNLSETAKSLLERLVEVDNQVTKLELKESELEQKFNAQHPEIQSLQEKKQSLQKQKAGLRERMSQLPQTEQKLLGLKRKVEVRTTLYTSLLNKAQEIKLIKAGTLGNVRIVDRAAFQPGPIEPKKKRIVQLSLVLGLFLGTGAVFLRRALNPAIHDPEGLESRLGYPVYAVLPHSRQESRLQRRAKRRKAPLPVLSTEAPNDSTVESMRSLRTSLQFALSGSESNCLVFTGASPSVGKTFVAVSMVHLLAQAGQKVLLVDCDMRKGTVHRYWGKDRSPGLSEYLAGSKEIQDILHPASGEGPECIFSGTLPPNPAELLMGQRLADLLHWAQEHYDQVILETTPVMAAADASIVAAHAGPVFFVVRAGMNTEQEVGQSIKRLQQNRVRVAGFVFNDLGGKQSDKSYTSRYGGYHYYRYSYK